MGKHIREWFASNSFHVVVVPLLFVAIGIIANRLGRRDNDDSPKVNDFAIGTSTILMGIGSVFADLKAKPDDAVTAVGWLAGMIVILMVSINNDRFSSWTRDANGFPTKEKHPWKGVILPGLGALLVFVMYQMSKT